MFWFYATILRCDDNTFNIYVYILFCVSRSSYTVQKKRESTTENWPTSSSTGTDN